MVVVMEERATEAQIENVVKRLVEMGMDVHRSSGATRTVLGVVGAQKVDPQLVAILDGVHEVLRITEPYKLASRTFKPEGSVVVVGDVRIGGDEVIVMAGPCSAESEPQVHAANLKALFELFESGKINPHVTELDGLDRYAEALDVLNGRRSQGKVVIRVAAGEG